MVEKLNLIWRIVGGNAILAFLGILRMEVNSENASYLIITNLLIVVIVSVRVIRNKLTSNSTVWQIMTVYLICRVVIDMSYTQSKDELILALLSTLVGSLWMIKYILPQKRKLM